MPKKQPPATDGTTYGTGAFMRVANGDVMTALTRACMILCTAMVGLLLWQAQQIIEHMKEQDTKIETAVIHQATQDGTLLMLQQSISDQARRLGRLEDVSWGRK